LFNGSENAEGFELQPIFYILADYKQLDRQIFTWPSHLVSLLFNESIENKMAEKQSEI
jgi:hypothetical protein